jgi:hypothetical protein
MKKLFLLLALLTVFMIALPAAAIDAGQGIAQNGNDNTATQQINMKINHANIDVPVVVNSDPIVNVIFPTPLPQASYLGVGDVSYTRVIYPYRFAVIAVQPNEVVRVRSGTPVALYTIKALDKDTVMGSQSIPQYDSIFDRMDYGTVAWVDWIPYYTTSSTITVHDANYLVIDNRNIFTSYNLVEITVVGEILPAVQEIQGVKIIEKPDVYPTDAYGRAITS